MNRVAIDIPEDMAAEIQRYLTEGRFASEQDLMRAALKDFLRRNRIELTEGFQEQDIEWASKQRRPVP